MSSHHPRGYTPQAGPPSRDLPPDPEDIEMTRPDDIDACPKCDGLGGVEVVVEGELTDDVCPRCGGSGRLP